MIYSISTLLCDFSARLHNPLGIYLCKEEFHADGLNAAWLAESDYGEQSGNNWVCHFNIIL